MITSTDNSTGTAEELSSSFRFTIPFSHLKLEGVEEDEDRFVVTTQETDQRDLECSECGSIYDGGVHSYRDREVRDLCFSGKRTFLQVPYSTLRCDVCDDIKTQTVYLGIPHKKTGKRQARYIHDLSEKGATITEIKKATGAGWKTVRNLLEEEKPDMDIPTLDRDVVGIDLVPVDGDNVVLVDYQTGDILDDSIDSDESSEAWLRDWFNRKDEISDDTVFLLMTNDQIEPMKDVLLDEVSEENVIG